jgi:hypothetical protein
MWLTWILSAAGEVRMPQGYYTIEEWNQPRKDAPPEWAGILTLPFGATLTDAEQALAQLDKPGFYRVVQVQRVVWAERAGGKLKLRKSHAGSPESLDRMRQMYERCGGRYPEEEVRAARRKVKKDQGR